MASFEPQDFFDSTEPPPRPTTPPVRRGFLLVLAILTLAAVFVYGIPYAAQRAGYAWESGRARAATEALAKLEKARVIDPSSSLFRLATVAVSPAVVNIGVARHRQDGDAPGQGLGPDRGIEGIGVGSGFVIDKDNGFIVTNNHVVRDADVIMVRLGEGLQVPARLVGADPKTDIAVIQVRTELKAEASWGDSDKLASGDWVLAIGYPYMLDHTVTAGIISGTGRRNMRLPLFDQESYQDFLQTDAAINPGNSGGPLIDLTGRVVGINTAIFTTEHGGFEGIGLAIPSAMARPIVEGLIKHGRVIRGYLGVMITGLTPELVRRLNLTDARGSLVIDVQPGSPAAKAGIAAGDVIIKVGDKDVPDPSSLRNQTARLDVGADVPVTFVRGGKVQTVKVMISELPAPPPIEPLGFRLLQLPPGRAGNPIGALVIDQVVDGSPAAVAGLRPNMKIIGVGKTRVHTRAEFAAAMAPYRAADKVPLEIQLPSGEIKVFEISTRGQDRGQ